MGPKISVVMSVRNGERYLGASVDSILRQSFSDFEFIIIDDGSTDDTASILSDYAAHDERIRVFTNPVNLGLTRSLNIGLGVARGEYIARQDADDISLPMRFEVQRRYLDENPQFVLVSGRIETIDDKGNITGKIRASRPASSEVIPWMLLFYNYLQGHSLAMFRREAALRIGGYDETYRFSQDYDLWLRLSRLGHINVIEHMLLQLRMHGESISKTEQKAQRKFALRCSQRTIEALCGRKLRRSDIEYLRNFWKGQFGKAGTPGRIHTQVRTIFNAYTRRGGISGEPIGSEQAELIARLIYKQFLLWERNTKFGHAPVEKLSAGIQTWKWQRPPSIAELESEAKEAKTLSTSL